MSGPENRSIQVTSLLALFVGVLMLLVALLAYWSTNQARGVTQAIQQSMTVKSQALTVLGALQDAETGQRGFLLTGNEAFLAPYQEAAGRLQQEADTLVGVVTDSDQARRARRLASLSQDKLDELQRTLELVRAGQEDEAVAVVSAADGKAIMDEARRTVTRLLVVEDETLLTRERAADRWSRLSNVAIAVAAFCSFLLLCVTSVMTKRQDDLLRSRKADLEASNARLEHEVIERTADALAAKERAESDRAKVELLLQDMNHRVGNNLALVSSLLSFQMRSVTSNDARAALRTAKDRIASVAKTQRRLRLLDDMSSVRLDVLVGEMLADTRESANDTQSIEIVADIASLVVESRDAVALSILVNEVVTNAVKHAFVGRETGRIDVRLQRSTDGVLELLIEDDGIGYDDAGPESNGLGSSLTGRLAGQFGGTLRLRTGPGTGTRIEIDLPNLRFTPA